MREIILNEENSARIGQVITLSGATASEVMDAILFSESALALLGNLLDVADEPPPVPMIKLKLVVTEAARCKSN